MKICPSCGASQPWVMWRRCACGHDFGPAAKSGKPGAVLGLATAEPPREPDPPSAARLCGTLLLITLGCGLWLTFLHGLGTLLILISNQSLPASKNRSLERLDWLLLAGLLLFGLSCLWAAFFRHANLFQHPAVVLPLWALMTLLTYRHWRRLKPSPPAS